MFLKKISKFEVLGFINCFLAALQVAGLFSYLFDFSRQISIDLIIERSHPALVLFISLVINVYLAYKLLWRHYDLARFRQYLILTFLTVFWFIWLLAGYFFVSEFLYPLMSLISIIGIFFNIRKLSIKWAVAASFMSFLVVVMTVVYAFEEDYCWKKGDELAIGKPGEMTITTEEARVVVPYWSNTSTDTPGLTKVGTSYYYHFKCHENFDLGKALREKYLLLK